MTSSETRHTPAPWSRVDIDHRTLEVYATAHHYPIAKAASYWNGPGPRTDEAEANAQLISAAPELLAACVWLKPYAEVQIRNHPEAPDSTGWQSLLDAVDKAIAKATA